MTGGLVMDSLREGQSAAYRFELFGRGVDVWCVRLQASDEATARLQGVLTRDETERATRFRFDHLRRSFVLSRGTLRILLGRYLGIGPQDVEFSYGSKGKPSLRTFSTFNFNVSHSGSVMAISFTVGCEIGIDVE